MFMSELSIFRAYDIRGVYGKTIDENIVENIGGVFGNFVKMDQKNDSSAVFVARDVRASSPSLQKSFMKGIAETGVNVFNLGTIPLTVAAFYAWKNKKYLAYVTASHMPKEWNGIKMFNPEGIAFPENDNNKIKKMYVEGVQVSKIKGDIIETGSVKPLEQYKNLLLFKVSPKKKLKIVTDAGNGVADIVLRDLLKKAGHSITSINSEPDGTFPNRKIDPHEDGLKQLREEVLKSGADVGFAFDGDADRIVVVSNDGKKISSEELTYIVLRELYKTEKGPVIANIECSYSVDEMAKTYGQSVVRVPVGDTHIMEGVQRLNGVFGIEKSGHACIPSIVPCDDAIAISYYISCILGNEKISDIIKSVPTYYFDRMEFECKDDIKPVLMDKIKKDVVKKYGIEKTSVLDGIRVDIEDKWALIRQSNTEPIIRLTVESKNKSDLQGLKEEFSKFVQKYVK